MEGVWGCAEDPHTCPGLDCVPRVPLHPSSEQEEMGVSGVQTYSQQ